MATYPLYQAVILAIVQGLTEFLPVSSSAHLDLFPWLLKWQDPGLSFDIALHVGTLIAIHLYGNKMLIDDAGGLGVFIGLAVHHVTPVAPHRANVEKDGLVLGPGARKRLFTPRVPLHGLVPG